MFPKSRNFKRYSAILLTLSLFLFVVFVFNGTKRWNNTNDVFPDTIVNMEIKNEARLQVNEQTTPGNEDGWAEPASSEEVDDEEDTEAWGKKLQLNVNSYKKNPDTTDAFIQSRFNQRQRNVSLLCQNPEYKHVTSHFKKMGRHADVAFKRLHMCMIPKVGTTFFKHLERSVFRPEYAKRKTELKAAKTSKKSFFLVREPYSRLVSAYIGKIVTNAPWWKYFGTYIVQTFRKHASSKSKRCGSDVTFPEFLKYFIHAQKYNEKKNGHFIPLHEFCDVCNRHYDFIGHLETFKEDLSYMFHSVNISLRLDLSDEKLTIKGKAQDVINKRSRIVKCEKMCDMLQRVWWSFQARGLISTDIPLPVRSSECLTIKPAEFSELALKANEESQGRMDKRKQKREALVKLYLQVPLKDRLTVQSLLKKDFELYGYDPQPADIFPELVKTS